MHVFIHVYTCSHYNVHLHIICSVVPTGVGVTDHTPWPLRNSKVFRSLNAVMERCNDLTELVHTMHDFRYIHVLMRVERRKEERSKQGQTNNKAKQHSTPKAVTCTFTSYTLIFTHSCCGFTVHVNFLSSLFTLLLLSFYVSKWYSMHVIVHVQCSCTSYTLSYSPIRAVDSLYMYNHACNC